MEGSSVWTWLQQWMIQDWMVGCHRKWNYWDLKLWLDGVVQRWEFDILVDEELFEVWFWGFPHTTFSWFFGFDNDFWFHFRLDITLRFANFTKFAAFGCRSFWFWPAPFADRWFFQPCCMILLWFIPTKERKPRISLQKRIVNNNFLLLNKASLLALIIPIIAFDRVLLLQLQWRPKDGVLHVLLAWTLLLLINDFGLWRHLFAFNEFMCLALFHFLLLGCKNVR